MNMLRAMKKTGLMVGTAFCVVAADAQTNVLFNSLGGRPAGSDAITFAGPIAESFTAPASAVSLYDVWVKLTDAGNVGTGATTVSLYGSAGTGGSSAPATLLDNIGIINDSQLSSTYQDYEVPLTIPYALSSDSQYWIVLSADGASSAQWAYTLNATGPGVAGEYFHNSSGTQSTSAGPYGLEVLAATGSVAAPEPSTFAMLGVGGAALVFHLIRRKRPAV